MSRALLASARQLWFPHTFVQQEKEYKRCPLLDVRYASMAFTDLAGLALGPASKPTSSKRLLTPPAPIESNSECSSDRATC
mmetsp:Transcript_25093/g.58392  ORF Transcript_25093/g.58392 Transcript_25093/m.58392 type:complete len:81 (-) Transcript_25093:1004-1246(-)